MLNNLLIELRFALSFLTLLPCSPKEQIPSKKIADSVAFFTFSGLFFSLLTWLCFMAFVYHQNTWLLAITVILSHVLLSGGLHLDALMDSHDGLAVSDRPKEKILEVMKDSRAGAFAVIALFFTMSSQLIFISQANYDSLLYVYLLCLTPVLSRFLLVIELIFFVDKDKLDEKSSLRAFTGFNKIKVFILNFLVLAIAVLLYPKTKICIVAFVLPVLTFSVLLYRFLKYKLKGQNGDSLGCGLVLNESFMYLLLVILSPVGA